ARRPERLPSSKWCLFSALPSPAPCACREDPNKRPTGPAGVMAARLQFQQPRPAARPVAMGMQRPMVVGPRPVLGRPPMMVQGPAQGGKGFRPPVTPGQQPRPGSQGSLLRGLVQKF
ncbi:unnamed protein product, partial [Prorocentrum cordatum]